MTETVGQKLLQARKERGVSLDEVARATRIRVHYLEALEADNLALLPSQAHTRGFIRLYADYLGLDPNELLPASPAPKIVVKSTAIKAPIPASRNEVAQKAKTPNAAPTPDKTPPLPAETKPVAAPVLPKVEPEKPKGIKQPFPKYTDDEIEEESPKTSQEMFAEIGQSLQAQREMLNLSPEEVERFTRLRAHHIKALETGRLEDLASPVQARGMLSNYAKFLNLDEEKLMLAYADALQARRLERAPLPSSQPSEGKPARRPSLRRFLSLDLIVGSLILIGMFAFLIWGLSQVVESQKQTAAQQSTLPSVAQVLAISPTTSPGTPAPSLLTSTTPGASLPNQTLAVNATANLPPAAGAQPAVQATSASPGQAGATSTPLSGPIQIYVVARNNAWMKVLVDGKQAFIGRVTPGNAYAYAGNKEVEVISGNAAALQIIYNQNDMGSLGSLDQVIDLIFTTKGLVAPTPTITPSPTKVLTSTPGPSPTGTPLNTPTIHPSGTVSPTATLAPTATATK